MDFGGVASKMRWWCGSGVCFWLPTRGRDCSTEKQAAAKNRFQGPPQQPWMQIHLSPNV